jgi:hypothetical protein
MHKSKNIAYLSALVVVAILAVAVGVRAYSGFAPKMVCEGGANCHFNEAPAPLPEPLPEPREELGAMTSPDIISPYISVNDDMTYHITGRMINASTTIVSFKSPFLKATTSASDVMIDGTTAYGYTSATGTVELVRLDITGKATSTYTISCGASAGPTTAPSLALLSSGSIATSSLVGVVENNLTNTNNMGVTGGTVAKIAIGPSLPYFVCKVTTAYSGAFTEVTNTFDGYFAVRMSKTRY